MLWLSTSVPNTIARRVTRVASGASTVTVAFEELPSSVLFQIP
jgi:hypothetical protein